MISNKLVFTFIEVKFYLFVSLKKWPESKYIIKILKDQSKVFKNIIDLIYKQNLE